MAKAIRVHAHGGPEVLSYEDVPVVEPGPGEVRVRHTFIGLNFIDTYQRAGLYKVPLPFTPGVGGEEKARMAREHGCEHVIIYSREDFVSRVREITGGRGVRVVYDGVGKDTFSRSLDCLSARGLLVAFGQSSGAVPPFDILTLS